MLPQQLADFPHFPLKAHQVYAHQVGHGKELNLLAAEIADLRGFAPEVMVTTVNKAILNGESMVNLWLIYG